MKYILAVLCLGWSVALIAAPSTMPDVTGLINFQVEKYQLKNGLTVLLHEDHSTPLLTVQQWYRVGSSNERPGRTGLAHFFEHLMFKGTKTISPDEYERRVQGNGGSNNAFTSRDFTAYFENMPAGKLEMTLELEADRMKNLIFDPEEIKNERSVVKEERRYRVDNNIQGLMFEAVFKTAYKVHPYRWPIIGYMKDLNAASIGDLKAFYRTYYAPNNSVLVIVGDFQSKKAKSWVEKYYGHIKPSELPKPNEIIEGAQQGQRRTRLAKQVQSPSFAVVYRGPKAGEDDAYALDVLASILGEGRSSRLYQKLVYRHQVSTSVSVSYRSMKDSGLFFVLSQVSPKESSGRVIRMYDRELVRIKSKGVTEKELAKARNQIVKGSVDSLKTVQGKAYLLAVNEIYFKDYKQGFMDLARYNKVTGDDVIRVAKKYLLKKYRSIITLGPKLKQKRIVETQTVGGSKG